VIHEHGAGGALVLERSRVRPTVGSPGLRRTSITVGDEDDRDDRDDRLQPPAETRGSFRSPSLILLAGAAIYFGYRSSGVIATDGTHRASLTAARPMLLVQGACLLAAGLLLTRPVAGRRASGRTAVAGNGTVVLLASVVASVTGRRAASDALGIAELAFAAVTIGVAVAAERHRQRGFRQVARSGR
jgi:hypothetical protein